MLFRAFCEVMRLFRSAQFSHWMHLNWMVRYRCYAIAPQSLGYKVPAVHLVTSVKGAVLVKYARTFLVVHVHVIVAAPKMVGSHKDEGIITQTEIDSFHYDRAMPVKPQPHAKFHSPRQRRPSHSARAFAPGHPGRRPIIARHPAPPATRKFIFDPP